MHFKNICWKYAPKQDGTCSVKVYVNLGDQQKYYPVDGVYVDPKDFDDKRGLVRSKHPLAKVYNAKIRALRNQVEEHFVQGGAFATFQDGKTARHSLIEYTERFIDEAQKGVHGLAKNTIKGYNSLLARLRQFAATRPGADIFFDEVNKSWEAEYTLFLCEECGVKLVTVGRHMKNLKRVMAVAGEIGLHNNTEYPKFKTYSTRTSDKIYLNEQEIESIAALNLSAQPHLERERGRFLVAYFFILRFSDVKGISPKSFFEDQGKKYFRVVAQKTKNEAILPVKPTALQLLEKYEYNFSWGTNQQANRFLKVIAAMAGINDILDTEPPVMKSQLVTTHTARRSAATNLRLQGASLKTIADLGGWKDVHSLQLYLRASGLDSARLARELDFFK